jgi:hypothetical protein
MIRNTALKIAGAALVAGALSLPLSSTAQPSAHYAPGLEGIKAATLPPPGLYLRDYNLFYYSDRLNNSNGREIKEADVEAFIYANAPRLVWITDYKLLGGYLGFDALIPLQYTSLEANTPGGRYKDSTFGIGDLFGEVTLSWHGKQYDAAIGYGIWAPTGDSSAGLTTRAGQGFWTHMFTAGATFYPDEAKKWSISALNRYEINTEKKYTDITRGDVWTIEGGIGRMLTPTIEAGVVSYYQRQLESDKGASAQPGSRDWVVAVGPELAGFYPRIMFGWSIRYLYEVEAVNRLQGHTTVLTLTKRF